MESELETSSNKASWRVTCVCTWWWAVSSNGRAEQERGKNLTWVKRKQGTKFGEAVLCEAGRQHGWMQAWDPAWDMSWAPGKGRGSWRGAVAAGEEQWQLTGQPLPTATPGFREPFLLLSAQHPALRKGCQMSHLIGDFLYFTSNPGIWVKHVHCYLSCARAERWESLPTVTSQAVLSPEELLCWCRWKCGSAVRALPALPAQRCSWSRAGPSLTVTVALQQQPLTVHSSFPCWWPSGIPSAQQVQSHLNNAQKFTINWNIH